MTTEKNGRFLAVATPDLSRLEEAYLLDAFRSGWISSIGEYVTRFEATFAKLCDTEHCVALSNGTVALHLALVAAGIGPGDEVIIPAMTFVATAAAVLHAGATPVFVDTEPSYGTIAPSSIERAITTRTKAIIPVHLYGHPADMDPVMDLARTHSLTVIEDAAEAHGAVYKGRPVGSIGDLATFSFYGNKVITTGEGGAIVTNDQALAARIRLLKDHAMDPGRRYWHPEVGYNYRLTNLQAAIGCAQVERFPEMRVRREVLRARYASALDGGRVRLLPQAEWAEPVTWLVSATLDGDREERDNLIALLKKSEIDSRPFFYLVSDMPPYTKYPSERNMANARRLSDTGINLPSSLDLTDDDIARVAEAIRRIVG